MQYLRLTEAPLKRRFKCLLTSGNLCLELFNLLVISLALLEHRAKRKYLSGASQTDGLVPIGITPRLTGFR